MPQGSLLADNCCRSQLSEPESEPETETDLPLTLSSSATIVRRKEVQKNKSDDDQRILKINIKLIDKSRQQG